VAVYGSGDSASADDPFAASRCRKLTGPVIRDAFFPVPVPDSRPGVIPEHCKAL
jgi:hypothetical protein